MAGKTFVGRFFMECREYCGACCIAISISSFIPGMPKGKSGGIPCVNLLHDMRCRVYNRRPDVCRNFMADPDYCGNSREEALRILADIELKTGAQ